MSQEAAAALPLVPSVLVDDGVALALTHRLHAIGARVNQLQCPLGCVWVEDWWLLIAVVVRQVSHGGDVDVEVVQERK